MSMTLFEPYLRRWNLQPDGTVLVTPASHLLPVRTAEGEAGMLKLADNEEERYGGLVMSWWGGEGAARVLAHEPGVVLMERALSGATLRPLALDGRDDEASRIACAVAARLHAPRAAPRPAGMLDLGDWFRASLAPAAAREGGLLAEGWALVQRLLAEPQGEPVLLHGDLHHDNVLDFGPGRGWLAIDPKRVIGERSYDFANLLCNPELPTSSDPARFQRQSAVIAQAAGLEPARLLQWTCAHACLSAAWFLEDEERDEAEGELAVAALARQALGA
ncbi:aminoglycoside phosphotransferase family protein [Roseateles sp. DAIF2]|uniref:aminoglycoside phosphotransferase family protein n=1 Tax=Roseateles sp. DAIF2 TaxID=2714952 RepID=UPI00201DF652|nr:aminoglycoside phosphotransferase family protein [Roseateles sp. DAIF2]